MFWHIVQFELKYRLRRVSTYVYFAIWFFMAFFSVSVRQFGPGSIGGKVLLNSPYTIALVISSLSAFGIVVVAAIFGTAIYRDFEEDTYQLLFTTSLRKRDYLGGRFVGSYIVTLLIFSGLLVGLTTGTFMPWADQTKLMPINFWFHIQPFLLFTAINVFFAGALFFAIGALTRNIVFVYLQGVVFLSIYLAAFVLISVNPDNLYTFWPAFADPFAMMTLDKVTRYWTVVEKNALTVPFTDVMLWNRVLWASIGVFAILALRLFPFSAELLARKRRPVRVDEESTVAVSPVTAVITAAPQFDRRTLSFQFASLTRLRLFSIVKEVPFAAIVLIGFVFVILDGSQAGRFFDTPVYPVTYIMASFVGGEFMLFVWIITTLYAGELVWKERTLKYDQIHDAVPIPSWLNFTSQLTALTTVQAALLLMIIVSGVALQAFQGYYRFELDVYFKELFLIALPNLIVFSIFALFLQTILPNKFLAHALVIGWFIGMPILQRYGFENPLYRFGELPLYDYSDMNGYGHYVKPVFWFSVYWLSGAAIMGTLAILFTRRGTDIQLRARLKQAAAQGPVVAMCVAFVIAFGAIGGYIYYNTNRLNEFETMRSARVTQAAYEKAYKKYEGIAQPKITGVDLKVDIFPSRRSFAATGTFILVNKSSEPIPAIHVADGHETLKEVTFDRGAARTHADKEFGYYIYTLTEPLKPEEALRMDFAVAHESKGFRSSSEHNEFAFNGTFFDRGHFPLIGYQNTAELNDDDQRRDQGLQPVTDMPDPQDPVVRQTNLFTPDADWVTFKCTVSTDPDQIAIAPGYLQREWTEDGRRYFSYDMGDTPIANFYSFVSGRYEVKRDRWNDISIEVYYDPKHSYNVDRMIESAKKGFDYFTTWFGPYQFRQFRIIEFPRYRRFAQSFPNTVPYSEGVGFIAHATREEDVDVPFYVTAHELAHQWWGHQVVGAYAQGSNMLSETLAQYAALMVMEKEIGPENIRKYLKHELNRYLMDRGRERRKEMPLARVQREGYVWYQKGSLVMYALKDYLGEERLNLALRKYLDGVRFQRAPYSTSDDFINVLRDAAPPDMKSIIADLFETITLFDNRATEASWQKTPEGKYAVKLKVSAKKLRADGLGAESEIPIDDLVDIGIFTGSGKDERPLFLEKRRIKSTETAFEIVVDSEPSRAGIDPYNKLVDRAPDDNTVSVTKL